MRLKSRRKEPFAPGHHPGGMPQPTGVPVVDGQPVEPYELPDDPAGNERELRRIAESRERQAEAKATMFSRGLWAVARSINARKGRGFEVTLFRRYTLEFHRLHRRDGEKFRLELYRARRWDINIELWRGKAK